MYTRASMKNIIGVDEVGRGAWAGPLVVGAVLLNEGISKIADSKTLSAKIREQLNEDIIKKADFVGLGWATALEVDDLGLTKATTLACKRALKNSPKNTTITIDGSFNYLPENKLVKTVVNADAKVRSVSAASIVAKVARDKYMKEQAVLYKNYGFESNVGYGTTKHCEAIKKYGLTPIHRWSYKPIKDFMDNYET